MSQPKANLMKTASVKFWQGLTDNIIKDSTNGCLTTEISCRQLNIRKEIPMSYDEMEASIVWLYKFVFYSIAMVGLLMAGMFAIQLFV